MTVHDVPVESGPRALEARRKRLGWSKKRLERELGVASGLVTRWENEERRPDLEHRILLELLFGIPRDVWLTPEERLKVQTRHNRLVAAAKESIDERPSRNGTEG